MHPDLKSLIELQNVDLRLAELRTLLAGFPKRLAEIDARVETGRKQLAAAREALTSSLKERKKFELDVEQWKERARKYRGQSAEVKTNEAYKALQHEIQNAEAEIAKAEDRLLERMVAGEEYELTVKEGERALKEMEAAAQVDRERIETEQAAVQKEVEACAAERERVVHAVPEELLEHYQRIAQRHHGVALAEVRDETCSLCRVRVRPAIYQELRRESSREIFHCESCTRILYCAEHASPRADSATPQPAETGAEES